MTNPMTTADAKVELVERLRPCPFCGHDAELFERYPKLWNVRCTNSDCGATIDPTQRSKQACAEVWNRNTFGASILTDIGVMMSEFVDNWPKPKQIGTALALIAKTLRAALEAPHSMTEAVTDELLEKLIAAVLAHTDVHIESGELRMHKAAVKADMIDAMQAARPIDQQEAMETCDQCNGAGGDNQHSICGKCNGSGGYPIAPMQDDDAKKRLAELRHWFFQKLNPEQRSAFLFASGIQPKTCEFSLGMQHKAIEIIANRLGNQSVGGEGRG